MGRFFKQGFKTMGFCCSSGLLFRPKLEYLLSPTPIQLPLLGSEFALQIRLNSSPRPRPKVSSQKQISLKKEKVLFLSAQNFICQILLELQSDMSSII